MMSDQMAHKTILIVDDKPDNLQTMVEIIEQCREQYSVLQAFDGQMALKVLGKREVDLVITDWEMPAVNGIELIKKIKADASLADIPVIMCTGVMTSSKDLDVALDAGAVDYIRKPIDEVELRARVRSMLQLSDSYRQVKELQMQKDKLYSIIAHDLRGSIGSVKVLLEFLLQDEERFDTDQLKEYLATTAASVRSGYLLLENLLAWAQRETGLSQVEIERVNLKKLTEDTLDLFNVPMREKNLSLKVDLHDDYVVEADWNMLAAIMRNLISNAIKFSDDGGSIKVLAQPRTDQEQMVVTVMDEGTGMPPEVRENLFDFTRTKVKTGTQQEKGSGLGLLICHEFIHANGGDIWVESEPGKGTSFSFSIPSKMEEQEPVKR